MQTPTLGSQLWLSWSPFESKGHDEKTGWEKCVPSELSLPIRICDLFASLFLFKKIYVNSI